ncbi:alpha/beta fold hydrolase [Sphingorhabdus sp. Alg231-15]|uniref:alpha/beta fold hydrolase n=1 Tax=Sphingorhabdus sp. Alg231-15 TaxID=1922222 RepID=UPI000D55FFCE
MKKYLSSFMAAILAAALLTGGGNAFAQTNVQQIALEANDGNRVTGFIYQNLKTEKDAPLAILMHGMTGSSLMWLANDHGAYGDIVVRDLIARGYRVVALDARAHGARKDDMKPLERLKLARSGQTGPYLSMINGTVSDYKVLLAKVRKQFGEPRHILAIGYSMGAQMAVLFAAEHEEITHIVTMVPPAAKSVPIVAPVNHAKKVKANWLLITASQDQFSNKADNEALMAAAGGKLDRVEFDSKHRLPRAYTAAAIDWIGKIETRNPAN